MLLRSSSCFTIDKRQDCPFRVRVRAARNHLEYDQTGLLECIRGESYQGLVHKAYLHSCFYVYLIAVFVRSNRARPPSSKPNNVQVNSNEVDCNWVNSWSFQLLGHKNVSTLSNSSHSTSRPGDDWYGHRDSVFLMCQCEDVVGLDILE